MAKIGAVIPYSRFRRERRRILRLLEQGHPPIVITVRNVPSYVIETYGDHHRDVSTAVSEGRLDPSEAAGQIDRGDGQSAAATIPPA